MCYNQHLSCFQGGWVVGGIEIKATQPSWSWNLGWAWQYITDYLINCHKKCEGRWYDRNKHLLSFIASSLFIVSSQLKIRLSLRLNWDNCKCFILGLFKRAMLAEDFYKWSGYTVLHFCLMKRWYIGLMICCRWVIPLAT